LKDSLFLSHCAACNPTYGKEIVFNYHQIQLALIDDIIDMQLLDTSEIQLFQYQFELLNMTSQYSSAISDVRQAISQKTLSASWKDRLSSLQGNLEPQRYQLSLQRIHAGLEELLCFVRN